MLPKLFHALNIMFISQVFKILLSRPTLSELEELFPDLSSFAKADSGKNKSTNTKADPGIYTNQHYQISTNPGIHNH